MFCIFNALKSSWGSVFHMKKLVGGCGHLRQVKIQRDHGLTITSNVLSTSNPSHSEINVAVYNMKKNLIAILHHSIQAGDSAKKHRFCPPDKNSWFDWQQERWPIKGSLLSPGFCGIVAPYPRNVKLHRTEMNASILWFGFSAHSINVLMRKWLPVRWFLQCYIFIMELLAAKDIIKDHHIFTQTFQFSLVCTLVDFKACCNSK